MSYEVDEEVQLDESKFLSEQVNWDEEPTEEEIIEKAEELGIDDYTMAKEALLKQLDPEWRPYINRRGQVFYINLEEKKGFVDHPIDMFYKIHYAIKTKKKIPTFQEYSLSEISEDPKILLREIANYKKEQGLRVVYQESQEESVRKNTKRSVEEDQFQGSLPQFNLEYEKEVKALREEMEREMNSSLSQYRKNQEKHFRQIEKRHQNVVERAKQRRLAELADELQSEWDIRNKVSFMKAIQTTKIELNEKKIRFEDLYQRQWDLQKSMYSLNDLQMNYRLLYKSKVVNVKQKQKETILNSMKAQLQERVNEQIYKAKQQYEKQAKIVTDSKLNYGQIFDRNLREIRETQSNLGPRKRKFSIFCPETKRNKHQSIEVRLNEFNCREQVWSRNGFSNQYMSTSKPSLSLRLFKKIL